MPLNIGTWVVGAKGYVTGGAFGGSIKLDIDGDSLARLVLFMGDDCCGPNGFVNCLGTSKVDERIGS